MDEGDGEAPGPVVRGESRASVVVRFYDRRRWDDDAVRFSVEARAPGLHARLEDVTTGRGREDLADFLDALAADTGGWDGERAWQTGARDLALRAAFRPGGDVGLTWTLRPWLRTSGAWEVAVTTSIHAGQQLERLAADVRRFLHGDQPGEARGLR